MSESIEQVIDTKAEPVPEQTSEDKFFGVANEINTSPTKNIEVEVIDERPEEDRRPPKVETHFKRRQFFGGEGNLLRFPRNVILPSTEKFALLTSKLKTTARVNTHFRGKSERVYKNIFCLALTNHRLKIALSKP